MKEKLGAAKAYNLASGGAIPTVETLKTFDVVFVWTGQHIIVHMNI